MQFVTVLHVHSMQVIPLHLPPGDTSTERTLQIDGSSEQIEAAKVLVNEVISEVCTCMQRYHVRLGLTKYILDCILHFLCRMCLYF